MRVYKTFENVENLKPCRKKPIIVHAKQVSGAFQVETLEGNYKQGKVGDYLMQGIDNELYICDKSIFERSYDWISEEKI